MILKYLCLYISDFLQLQYHFISQNVKKKINKQMKNIA